MATKKAEPTKDKKGTKPSKNAWLKYSAKDKDGFVHCNECPLVLSNFDLMCHATAHFDEKKNRWVLDDEENNQDG